MAARKCEQCGANVAADEQFCPTCGAFMDPLAHDSHTNVISVSSSGFERFDLSDPPPPDEPPVQPERPAPTGVKTIQCPSCGAANPANNRHCEECGARLSQAPLPTAPRPAVQATAGVRAALAIAGLLFTVVIVALAFNFLGGDGTTTSTTVAGTTTTVPVAENGPIAVINQDCSIDGLGSFVCANLTSGTDDSYQVNWEDLTLTEDEIVIRLTFAQPMVVQQVIWKGLEDPVRFKQNYRARGLVIAASDSVSDFGHELEDTPGDQSIPYAALGANWIEFTIKSAYVATLTEGNVFKEIAIDEITVIGRPQATVAEPDPTTSTTAP